jgi:hypothetical protein
VLGGHLSLSNGSVDRVQGKFFAFVVSLLFLPLAAAEVICALGPAASSYNAYQDQRPTPDAMELAGKVNAALSPICRPNCPEIAVFRNATAANAMLVVANGDAKIVYAPQFFTSVYDTYGEGAIVALIAHELGHAVDETAPAAWIKRDWPAEVRADAWAACALAKLNLSTRALGETLTALEKYPSPVHPPWTQRLPALRLGFTRCGGDSAAFDGATAAHKLK